MRRLALGVACLILTAGCLMASAQTESAMSLEDTARDRADENLEDPRLVGLWGVETPQEVEDENTTLRVHLDDEPGDGQAAGWAFRFVGQEQTGIIAVGDEVGVVAEFYTTSDHGESEAEDRPDTLAWEIDSEDAADSLAANESWPEMTDAHALSWELARDDNRTVWGVEAREINFTGPDTEHVAVVDAESGEILEVHEHDDSYFASPSADPDVDRDSSAAGGCEQGSDAGQVSPTDDLQAQASLAEDGRASISFDYGGAGPVDLTLTEGDETVWEDSITATGGDSYTTSVEDLDDGSYTLTASTMAGAVSGNLELVTQWGHGGSCPGAYDYGPGMEDDRRDRVPGWIHADRTLGVASLG